MLPMHPQPRQDELFSSWLVRLAFSNCFPLHTFYSKLLGYQRPIWNRDIDRCPPDQLLSLLSLETRLPIGALRAMALTRFEGTLYSDLPNNCALLWLLPLGIFHRTHKRAGLQYCPLCLKEDSIPYYRLSWRLALVVICGRHRCAMEEVCPQCGSPIMFHRHGIGRDKTPCAGRLRLCHACGLDLAIIPPRYPAWPDCRSQEFLAELVEGFESCPWSGMPGGVSCAMPFFLGLHTLLALLNGRFGERLQSTFCTDLGVEALPPSTHRFEFLDVDRRLQLMLRASWLLQDWPDRFVGCCREAGLTRSRITELPDLLPFWLESTLTEYLDSRIYSPSDQEIAEAASYLIMHGQEVTWHSLGQMVGLHRDSARRSLKRWQRG